MNFKIRAWDKVEKQMLKVGLVDFNDMTFYSLTNDNFRRSYSPSYEWHNKRVAEDDDVWGNPNDLIIMLYSNDLDANGDRLCEGDIVKFKGEYCRIVYDESCFYIEGDIWMIPLADIFTSHMEIVGNVYENQRIAMHNNQVREGAWYVED